MPYTPNIVSTVLFETSNVCVFPVPAGPPSLSKWRLEDSKIIWKGSLRLVEQEVIQDGSDVFAEGESHEFWRNRDDIGIAGLGHDLDHDLDASGSSSDHYQQVQKRRPLAPYEGLRAKIELYNTRSIPPSVGSLTTVNKDVPWAEIWYNPSNSIHLKGIKIANNGEETVQITESSRYYKIIAQLPASGYRPYNEAEESDLGLSGEGPLLQVGLGLKFAESYQAISFSESLNLYRRRYRNFEEQYEYDLKMYESEQSVKDSTLDEDTLFALEPQQRDKATDSALGEDGPILPSVKEAHSDHIHHLADDVSDEDEFDEFVSAS